MRKLNNKNKIFIAIFSIIIVSMIVILVVAVFRSQKEGKTVYNISNNSIIYDNETKLVDTSKGGIISKKWDGTYYYNDVQDVSYELGNKAVVYEKTTKEVNIFGNNYQVQKDGSIIENEDITKINDLSKISFYKLDDRVYLIVAPEIFNESKSVYASKYLVVFIDKKGNASFLNDVLNLKTINPMLLEFDEYTFDIANELLIIKEKTIDLKAINGSTNEYKPKEEKEEIDVSMKDLAEEYNNLVNSFQQYIDKTEPIIGANQSIGGITNVIVPGSNSDQSDSNEDKPDTPPEETVNLSSITKKASLRGAISNETHIDVSYSVSDVADQYQAVYLLVTGNIDGEKRTDKIILDKYQSAYRISNLTPKNEYTISLGYIEKVEAVTGEKILQDSIEDVVNVRTTKAQADITIDKIAKGYVHFTFKMKESYVIDSGKIALFAGGIQLGNVPIEVNQNLVTKGFSAKLPLTEASVFELRLIDAEYNGKKSNIIVKKQFSY